MKAINTLNAQADGALVVSKQYRCIKLGLDVHADSIRVVRMRINKCGNPRVRAALVVLAWRLMQHQPQCRLIQKWRHVLLNPCSVPGARKRAIVAVARQLAVDLWRWQTGRASPEQLNWQMTN